MIPIGDKKVSKVLCQIRKSLINERGNASWSDVVAHVLVKAGYKVEW